MYKKGIEAGALGGKILGAGGGGFFLFVVEKERQTNFIKNMQPLIVENFNIDIDGAKLVEKNF